MKSKSILFALLVIYGMFHYHGCDSDVPEPIDLGSIAATPIIRNPMPWNVVNGTFVFIDNDHLNQAIVSLSEVDDLDRLHFEDSLGIRTLKTIKYLVDEAESAHQDQFFFGVPDTLTDEQYRAMNYQPSSLFRIYEQAGVIRSIYEPDSSWYYSIRVQDETMWGVLNESGEVIVGDIRYVYRDSVRESYSLASGQLLESIEVGKQAGVSTNFNRHWHIGGSLQASNTWAWLYPCESKKRIAAKVQYSSRLIDGWVKVVLVVNVKAQKKKRGIWAERNDFKPFIKVAGSWNYRYSVEVEGETQVILGSEWSMSNFGYTQSPLSVTTSGKKDFEIILHPSGHHKYFYRFMDNVELLDPTFTFTFEGCPSQLNYSIP